MGNTAPAEGMSRTWRTAVTNPHTSVPSREKGHYAGWEHHAREEAAWPGHSGQPAASSVHSSGHPWMWSEGNSTAGLSVHLHLAAQPFSLHPLCARIQWKWGRISLRGQVDQAGSSGVVRQATASCGFRTPMGLELFRFRSKPSKLGYTFLLL